MNVHFIVICDYYRIYTNNKLCKIQVFMAVECIVSSQADSLMKLKMVFNMCLHDRDWILHFHSLPCSTVFVQPVIKELGFLQDQQVLMTLLLQSQQGFPSLEQQIRLLLPPWLVHWVETAPSTVWPQRQPRILLHRIQRFLSSFCGKMNPEESHLLFTPHQRQHSTL